MGGKEIGNGGKGEKTHYRAYMMAPVHSGGCLPGRGRSQNSRIWPMSVTQQTQDSGTRAPSRGRTGVTANNNIGQYYQ